MTQTDTAAPTIPEWHHPHFVSAEDQGGLYTRYTFKPFTGDEPEPDVPASVNDAFSAAWDAYDRARDMVERSAVSRAWSAAEREARAANTMWQVARHNRRAVELLQKVAPLVTAYQQAKAQSVNAYESLHATPDGFWQAKLLTLTQLREKALEAARQLGSVSNELATVYYGLPERVLEMLPTQAELEKTAGVDLGDWYPQESYSYGESPDTHTLKELFAEQDKRIAQVARLFGAEERR